MDWVNLLQRAQDFVIGKIFEFVFAFILMVVLFYLVKHKRKLPLITAIIEWYERWKSPRNQDSFEDIYNKTLDTFLNKERSEKVRRFFEDETTKSTYKTVFTRFNKQDTRELEQAGADFLEAELLGKSNNIRRDLLCNEIHEFWRLLKDTYLQTLPLSDREQRDNIIEVINRMDTFPTIAWTLDEWMDSKSPDNPTNQDAIYPSRSEFATGKVYFSDLLVNQVLNTMEQHQYARIVGNSAAGKSVLGARIAYDWQLRMRSTVYWLDLAEYDDVPDLIYGDIDSFLDNSDVQLLVIDNTHINPAIVQHAVKQLKRGRDNGFSHHRLLLISRPDTTPTLPHQAGIATQLQAQSIYINPDGELFRAVAERLRARHGWPLSWTTQQYEAWVREFGGDMICFGVAVLQAKRDGVLLLV